MDPFSIYPPPLYVDPFSIYPPPLYVDPLCIYPPPLYVDPLCNSVYAGTPREERTWFFFFFFFFWGGGGGSTMYNYIISVYPPFQCLHRNILLVHHNNVEYMI